MLREEQGDIRCLGRDKVRCKQISSRCSLPTKASRQPVIHQHWWQFVGRLLKLQHDWPRVQHDGSEQCCNHCSAARSLCASSSLDSFKVPAHPPCWLCLAGWLSASCCLVLTEPVLESGRWQDKYLASNPNTKPSSCSIS
jgi:hypothetical protein